MALENIGSFPEVNELMAEKALQMLSNFGVEWQGRDVKSIAEDLYDKIAPLFLSKIPEPSLGNSSEWFTKKAEVVQQAKLMAQYLEFIEESDRLCYYDPISGAYQILLAAQKHHKHQKRRWWVIGAVAAAVVAAVVITIATGGGAGPAAANGAASALGGVVATNSGRKEEDKKKDNKNASPSSNDPPNPKAVGAAISNSQQPGSQPSLVSNGNSLQLNHDVQVESSHITRQAFAVTKSQTVSPANVSPIVKNAEAAKDTIISPRIRSNSSPNNFISKVSSKPNSSTPVPAPQTYPSSFFSKQPEPFPAPSTGLGSGQSSTPAAIPSSLMAPLTPADFNAKINPTTNPSSLSTQIEAMTTLPPSVAQIQALTSPPSCSTTSTGLMDLKSEYEKKILASSNPTSVPTKTFVSAHPPVTTSLVPTFNPIVQKALETTFSDNKAGLAHNKNFLDGLKAVPATPTILNQNILPKQPEQIAMIESDAPVRVYSTAPEIKPSIIFQLEGAKLGRGCIGGINGIGNNLDEAKRNAEYLKKLSGNHHIEWVHNRTNSIPIDLAETVFVNFHGYSAPAKQIKEQWINFHEKHKDNPKAKYLQFCHSQGALHVRNALADAPKEIRDRIIVVAIAPAGIVPKNLCFQSYNYTSKKDSIPFLQVISLLGSNEVPANSRLVESILAELVFLDPHPDAPSFDHSFQSPTFQKIIKDHIEEFIKKYGELK